MPFSNSRDSSNVKLEDAAAPSIVPSLIRILFEPKFVIPEKPVPEVPDVPDVPDEPDVPDVPDEPDVPGVPEVPEEPEVPDVPLDPDEPDVPLVPELFTTQTVKSAPGAGLNCVPEL